MNAPSGSLSEQHQKAMAGYVLQLQDANEDEAFRGDALNKYFRNIDERTPFEKQYEALRNVLASILPKGHAYAKYASNCVAKLLESPGMVEAAWSDPQLKPQFAVALLLFAEDTMPFDDAELRLLANIMGRLTQETFDVRQDDYCRRVAEFVLGPVWTTLVYDDFVNRFSVPAEQVALFHEAAMSLLTPSTNILPVTLPDNLDM